MPAKKRGSRESVKSQIERFPQIADLEAHWFKDAGKEIVPAMRGRKPDAVSIDSSLSGKTSLHTHPGYRKPSLPSPRDLVALNNLKSEYMAVAAITSKGVLAGRTIVLKGEKAITGPMAKQILLSADSAFQLMRKEIDAVRSKISSLKKMQQTPQVVGRVTALYGRWDFLGRQITSLVHSTLKMVGWRMRFEAMPGFEFRNGYYWHTQAPPKPGSGVAVTESEAEKRKKQAEHRRRLNILAQQQRKIRIKTK